MMRGRGKKWMSLGILVPTVLSMLPVQALQAADQEQNTVFINEIESDDPNGGNDWIEIVNAGKTDVDISGWFVSDDKKLERLDDGSAWRIPDGTVLKAGEVLVLEDSMDFDFGLGKNDEVNLYNKDSELLDSYTWSSHAAGTYSRVPDGTGDFIDQDATKGQPNLVEKDPEPEPTGKALVINEINSAPDDWIEFVNTGTTEINISGFEIRDNSNDHRWKFPENTTVQPGGRILVSADTAGLVYDDQKKSYENGTFQEAIGLGSGDSVRLYDTEENLLDSYTWSSHASYEGSEAAASYGRYPDGTGAFMLMPETPGESNDCFVPKVVINEVESNGDATDWAEIYNAGTTDVDISGWYLLDNDPVGHANDITPVKEGTILHPGEYYVFDQNKDFTFGLGKEDCVTIFTKEGIQVAQFSWTDHANGVFARIPDGTGELVDYLAATKGMSNTEKAPDKDEDTDQDKPETIEWPGSTEVTIYDKEQMFLEDSSGLDFHNGQLYAVDNGTGIFWILDVAKDGTLSFADGFENGKRIRFQKDADNAKAPGPDTEGISVDSEGFVYVASERDNAAKGVNYNTILKVDPKEAGTDLVALQEWNLTDSLPQVAANTGIEAVEWVSNEDVAGKLYDQNTKAAFDPSNYPNATANGVFFVALEDNGHAYAYVLNQDGSVVQIADIDSKLGGAMALDYDTATKTLWVVADNGFGNRAAMLTFNGSENPAVVHVAPPSGLDVTRNNEGFAIAEADYTINGQRAVYRFTDGENTGALTIGSINSDYKATDNGTDDPTDGNQKPGTDVDPDTNQGSGTTQTPGGNQGTGTTQTPGANQGTGTTQTPGANQGSGTTQKPDGIQSPDSNQISNGNQTTDTGSDKKVSSGNKAVTNSVKTGDTAWYKAIVTFFGAALLLSLTGLGHLVYRKKAKK